MVISKDDILVGDIIHLEPGDVVPADGILVSGYNLRCDESSITGESDLLRKTPADQVMARIAAYGIAQRKNDPFILSGTSVSEGVGTYLVTCVGIHSGWGLVTMSILWYNEESKFEMEVDRICKAITKVGIGQVQSFLFPVSS